MIEMRCLISGKVQNVAYRAYVQDSADELSIAGYVKNLSDGTVEVVAQAEPLLLKDFVEYLHEGSALSRVDGVDVEWRSVSRLYDDFSIRH